jgi:Pyruvate/2-oxoacid:ferredoxin oxidoreductase delta subunit
VPQERRILVVGTTVYYFSGTGNSYRIAKTICDKLKNANIVNIAKQKCEESCNSNTNIVIVFPIYYFGIPVVVETFLRQIDIPKSCYVFIIATRGIPLAGGAKRQLDEVFSAKGNAYHFFRYITMGNNYPFYSFNCSKENIKNIRNQKASNKLDKLISNIDRQKHSKVFSVLDYQPFTALTFCLPRYGYKHFLRIYSNDSCFVVDESNCNKCKKCERFCPTNNITINTEVAWKHENCQMCLACYNCCLKNAIQYIDSSNKVSTKTKRQYWNYAHDY